MAKSEGTALAAGVKRLGERIEQWRQTRAKRTAMAPELWSAGAVLAERHGVYRVARALRINFECLKRRVAEAKTAAPTSTSSSAFVEWTGAQILSASPASGTVMEAYRASDLPNCRPSRRGAQREVT